jgi:hypothetical protein
MPDPTRVDGADDSAGRKDSTTAEAPARWSGAAPVPATPSKKSRKLRRADEDEHEHEDDWGATPAVDPWADQDTPWSLLPPAPPVTMPPTRIDAPAMPPTRIDAPASPPVPPAPAAPAPNPAPKRAGWGRRKQDRKQDRKQEQARQEQVKQGPANRLPVQPRPYTPPPPPWQPTTTRPPAPPRPGPPRQGPPATRPPTRPPTGMPPPRRRRRWPRNLLIFTLLTGVFCCGVPAYFTWPAARQYPVTADLPAQVRDLSLRDDNTSKRALEKLTQQLQDSNLAGQKVFGGIYADGNGKRVTVFGTTGLRVTPKQDVEAELSHLSSTYDIGDVESFDLGETGAHERCGVGRAGGNAVVVCAWADHGSLATVLLTRRNVSESAQLVADLRSKVLTRP